MIMMCNLDATGIAAANDLSDFMQVLVVMGTACTRGAIW